jgi:hypothetical protein
MHSINLSLPFGTMKTLTSTAFRGVISLQNLDLYFAGIKTIENNSFIDLNNLTTLFLIGNNI